MKRHKRNGWQILDLYGPFLGAEIKELERSLKRAMDFARIPRGHKAFREKFDGYTEAWQTVDLDVKSIGELVSRLLPGVRLNGTRKKADPKYNGAAIRGSTGWLNAGRQKMLVEA
jgi:hypothetical protein